MAYVSWFQRKFILISIIVVISLFSIFYTLCGLKDRGKQFSLLHNTQDEIDRLKSELLKVRHDTRSKVHDPNLPILYIITPTYTRHTQQADLVRMSNTLKHISNIHWILIEDSEHKTSLVSTLLEYSGLRYTHLNMRTQKDLVRTKNDPRWKKHRGVDQRNHGLKWIRKNIEVTSKGVIYFADDDNTYHLDLFSEMRSTKVVSMWPVALVGGLRWEGPVCENGKVFKFHTAWLPSRTFPVDMAAFAINLKLIFDFPKVYINPEVMRGRLETDFLEQFNVKVDDLEAKANDCSKILVWHTQTADPKMKEEIKLQLTGHGSDPKIII